MPMIYVKSKQNPDGKFVVAQFGKGDVGYTRVNLELDGEQHIGIAIGDHPMKESSIRFIMTFPKVELFDQVMGISKGLLELPFDEFPLIKLNGPLPTKQEEIEGEIETMPENFLDHEIREVLTVAKQMLEDRHAFNCDITFEQRIDALLLQLEKE